MEQTRWRHHAAPIALLALASVALTWPLSARLASELPAFTRVPDDDLLPNLWSFWWARESVLQARGSFWFTRDLFHPEGATLTLTALSPLTSLLVLPVLALVPGLAGLKLAWNLNVLATFWLSGAAMYGLAFRATRAVWPAFVAGVVFAFSPYRYDHLRHVNLSCTQWLPLVFLFLAMRIEGAGFKSALGLGVSAALVAGSSLTYVAQLPLFAALFVAAWAMSPERRWRAVRDAVAGLLLPGALALLLAAPALWPALVDMATLVFETPLWEDPVSFAYPIEAFLVPPLHPYVGLGVFILVVWALAKARWQALPWALIAFAGLALAPGPALKTLAGATGVPLPYAVVRYFPGLGQNRFTERFMVFWWLGAAVMAAMAMRRMPRWLCLVVAVLLVVDMRHVPLALEDPKVPPVYERLSEAPQGWPVYEWPATYLSNRWFMYYQIVHGRPICQGVLARRPLLSYQVEQVDAALDLRQMVLVVHKGLVSQAHARDLEKLTVLRKRYDVRTFHEDGETRCDLLSLRHVPPGR